MNCRPEQGGADEVPKPLTITPGEGGGQSVELLGMSEGKIKRDLARGVLVPLLTSIEQGLSYQEECG